MDLFQSVHHQCRCPKCWDLSSFVPLESPYFIPAAAKSRQLCPTLCDPIDDSPPGSRPWDSPSNNTGVGCHFLLQCMKVKSESEVAQLSMTLHNPMDCSLPGSSVHGISQARVLEWVAIAFSYFIPIDLEILNFKLRRQHFKLKNCAFLGMGRCKSQGSFKSFPW